ncbi:MAG: amidohydrolase [Actinobacteria bacterium]|nr:amidohydrolase [Actinomycetota bacterium]
MTDRYTIISSDCHAGGSHAMYREYLEERYLEDFDAWRGKYKNPFRDLQDDGRMRNWDDERRNGDLEADGIVGEVVYPNTVPPFFPSFVLFARPPKPDEYEHRLAGIRAHNRWMADFCERFRERRAGIGQVFLNDLDDAIADAHWIKEHGLRGGVLVSSIPPDVDYVDPLYDPKYDPFWRACEELELPVNSHGGTGLPDYGRYGVSALLYINEVQFYSQRPFVQLLLSGVFERFPNMKFVMTEMGCAWLPPMLRQMDGVLDQIRKTGRTGELRYSEEHVLPKSATEYFRQSCWVGVSQPGPADVAARTVLGTDRWMWGSDYPHDEGTAPFTREHLRQLFCDADPSELRQLLSGNAARLYGFDLDVLAPIAARVGPTVEEIAQPLLELPDHPNEALLKAAVPG